MMPQTSQSANPPGAKTRHDQICAVTGSTAIVWFRRDLATDEAARRTS
jgi:hypothetical protein